MRGSAGGSGANPGLVYGWLNARSVARGVPAPAADRGGWRVDTASDVEACRHVFATPVPAITELARSIDAPRIFIKLCAQDDVLAALLPSAWRMIAPSWLMTTDAEPTPWSVPIGYEANVEHVGQAIRVSIVASDGALAASGYAVEAGGFFVYDRIVTQPDHQRMGLGRAVMGLLGSRREAASRQVLVATEQGRALYTALGWRVETPYASAVIPDLET